jgi:aldose 1-epimerase
MSDAAFDRVGFVTLTAADARLVLAPAIGGSVVNWGVGGAPIMRPSSPDACEPRALACFPLVPFSNRIARGRFDWRGTTFQLPVGVGDPRHDHHGVGWQRTWMIADRDATSARLVFEHNPDSSSDVNWPFAFRAEQHFHLAPDRLEIALRIENQDRATTPAGIGLHPYFPRDRDTRLAFAATSVWQNGPGMLPARRTEVPPEWDFRADRDLTGPPLDNCFAGWDGRARIVWPNRHQALVITAGSAFGHLVVYAPKAADFVCVEPVSHMNDGINRLDGVRDHGIVALAPGAALGGEVTFCLEAL